MKQFNIKTAFIFILFGLSLQLNAQWNQVGNSINGENEQDAMGDHALSISSDGSIFAVGAQFNDGNGSNSGHVRVFQNISGYWTQMGSDLDGDEANRGFGRSVSLSSDGLTMAVGSSMAGCTSPRTVRVYTFDGSNWNVKGNFILGESGSDNFGTCVCLNADGNILAVGAENNSGAVTESGHARVYEYIGGIWQQIGSDIDGEATGDQFGWSLSLNSGGNIIAIGARYNDDNGSNAGHVRVYENIAGNWVQMGVDIEGEATGDLFGSSVSLNSSGDVLVAGAENNDGNGSNSGHARIFKYVNGNWIQLGNDIDGEFSGDMSGASVSMNSDGNIVAIGAPKNGSGATSSAGHVRIYRYSGSNWIQLGNDIDGQGYYHHSGSTVALCSDGMTVAIGAPYFDNYAKGQVRIFNNCTSLSTIDVSTCNDYISPSGNYTWTISGTYTDIISNVAGCDSIITINLTSNTQAVINQSVCNLSNVTSPSGNYIWTTSGTYYDTIPNSNGCDSLLTINLEMNYNSSSSISVIACESYVSPSSNYTWTSSGTYRDTILNSNGCDSIITIDLTINNNTYSTIQDTSCNSYLSPSGNYTWTSSGTYQDIVSNSVGCDSIITVNLVINYSNLIDTLASACDSFVWYGNTYTNSGQYQQAFTNIYGCDSIITLNLTINNIDTSITLNNNTLISNESNASYQWLNCDSSFSFITGETGQSFSPHLDGSYAVLITKYNCIDTSYCYIIDNTGIEQVTSNSNISIFPNPTSGLINIESENIISVEITDIKGNRLYCGRDKEIDLSNNSSGLYFLKVVTNLGIRIEKIILK